MDPSRKDGGQPPTKRQFEMRIVFDPATNKTMVSGPFENASIFLAMLEMAKLNLYEYRESKRRGDAPRIVVPAVRVPQA